MVERAKQAIRDATHVLVVAGAGMSASPGYNVYVDPADYAKYYPAMKSHGYSTAYESMGLFWDDDVPETVKWGFQAAHMHNMRWHFPPSGGYSLLKQLCDGKDTFVLTSNVDGMFERSGFPSDRIYKPQGDWERYQCLRPCSKDAVWESRKMLDELLPHINRDTQEVPQSCVPACPRCGGRVFGNVRGGDWFIHNAELTAQQDRLLKWVDGVERLVVLEIGAGMNTPVITRWPAEAIAAEKGAPLIRVNPAHPAIPRSVPCGIPLPHGWEVLSDILAASPPSDPFPFPSPQPSADWRDVMHSLR